MKKIIIAAISKNWVIGKDGSIPWHSKEEFKHFRAVTLGFPVIMGRKTFESIGDPLSERLNIIISRNKILNSTNENCLVFDGIDKAFDYCSDRNFEKVFIIGGGEIYSQVIDRTDEIILSILQLDIQGDTFFPSIDNNIWRLASLENFQEFEVCTYVRK